jgi:hypothetical protein
MTQLLESGEHAALQIPDDGHYPFAIAASRGCTLDVIYRPVNKFYKIINVPPGGGG